MASVVGEYTAAREQVRNTAAAHGQDWDSWVGDAFADNLADIRKRGEVGTHGEAVRLAVTRTEGEVRENDDIQHQPEAKEIGVESYGDTPVIRLSAEAMYEARAVAIDWKTAERERMSSTLTAFENGTLSPAEMPSDAAKYYGRMRILDADIATLVVPQLQYEQAQYNEAMQAVRETARAEFREHVTDVRPFGTLEALQTRADVEREEIGYRAMDVVDASISPWLSNDDYVAAYTQGGNREVAKWYREQKREHGLGNTKGEGAKTEGFSVTKESLDTAQAHNWINNDLDYQNGRTRLWTQSDAVSSAVSLARSEMSWIGRATHYENSPYSDLNYRTGARQAVREFVSERRHLYREPEAKREVTVNQSKSEEEADNRQADRIRQSAHFIADRNAFVIKPDVYDSQGNISRELSGFDGKEFHVQTKDGIVTTHNLWHMGEVPQRFAAELPDNAQFVSREIALAQKISTESFEAGQRFAADPAHVVGRGSAPHSLDLDEFSRGFMKARGALPFINGEEAVADFVGRYSGEAPVFARYRSGMSAALSTVDIGVKRTTTKYDVAYFNRFEEATTAAGLINEREKMQEKNMTQNYTDSDRIDWLHEKLAQSDMSVTTSLGLSGRPLLRDDLDDAMRADGIVPRRVEAAAVAPIDVAFKAVVDAPSGSFSEPPVSAWLEDFGRRIRNVVTGELMSPDESAAQTHYAVRDVSTSYENEVSRLKGEIVGLEGQLDNMNERHIDLVRELGGAGDFQPDAREASVNPAMNESVSGEEIGILLTERQGKLLGMISQAGEAENPVKAMAMTNGFRGMAAEQNELTAALRERFPRFSDQLPDPIDLDDIAVRAKGQERGHERSAALGMSL